MSPAPPRKLLSQVQNTIRLRRLFRPDQKLLVCVSGGKDSLVLLDCLHRLHIPQLHSLHIRLDGTAPLGFADFCRERSEFTVVDTDILTQVKAVRRGNKCYICSRLRRETICRFAVANGFDTLAFAHHRDDMIQTLLLNMLFQRELSTLLPEQELFGGRLRLVRPLFDTEKKFIARHARAWQAPVTSWTCGLDGDSRRAWIKAQIHLWQKQFPRLRVADNLYRAAANANPAFLPKTLYPDDKMKTIKSDLGKET